MRPDVKAIRAEVSAVLDGRTTNNARRNRVLTLALCDRVEALEAALRNIALDGGQHGEAAQAALNDHQAADPAPGTSNDTKGDPCP